MPDYEELILIKQDLVDIYEDEPDSSLCPMGAAGDDIPEEEFIWQYT